MASAFPHESACVVPHQCCFVFSVGMIKLFYIYSSISVLGPQVFCVIRIADFLVISFWTLHPRAFNASCWLWSVPCSKQQV